MIGKPIVQSIKLATCNIGIWPISDKLITTQATVIDCYWLAQQPWTDVTHATFPIIVHTLLHIRHVIELSHACHCFLCHYAICKKTGKRHWRERREYCSPADVQSIKMKCVYNYCVQRCDIYALIPSIFNQSIITHSFTIDWSSIINISQYNWYRLSPI